VKIRRARIVCCCVAFAFVGCNSEERGAIDPLAGVQAFAANPVSIRSGESSQLTWTANELVLSVRVTQGQCPERQTTGGYFTEDVPCADETVIASDLPRSGTLRVSPTRTTTYWCLPDRAKPALGHYGRTLTIEVSQ